VASLLSIDEQTMMRWLQLIEAHYHSEISYHNSTHAADVLQASAFFVEQPCIKVWGLGGVCSVVSGGR